MMPKPEEPAIAPRGLLWRYPAWFASALLLQGGLPVGYLYLTRDASPLPLPVAIIATFGAAWAFGLFSARTGVFGKVLTIMGSLFGPAALFFGAFWMYATLTAGHPPPLFGQQQIQPERDADSADDEWTQTLTRDFPVGSQETRLLSVLAAQVLPSSKATTWPAMRGARASAPTV